MTDKDLDGRLVFAEKQDFYREQVGLLQVVGSRCILSDPDGNSVQFPVGHRKMREATVAETVHCFFTEIFPELKDKEHELVTTDQAIQKIVEAAIGIFKQNQRKRYAG